MNRRLPKHEFWNKFDNVHCACAVVLHTVSDNIVSCTRDYPDD